MKTAEEIASTIYQPIGMSCNEFAIKLAKSYAKEVLEEYTNRIVENVSLLEDGKSIKGTRYYIEVGNNYNETEIDIDKESITNQLPLMLKEIL